MTRPSSSSRFDPATLRRTVLDMAYAGATVHIGCAFSIIELLAVLYRNHLRYPGNDPDAADRDYLVLSKGHGVMAQYACMREMGWLDDAAISGYFSDGSDLKGLSDSRVPGLEVTSGSLGHGFSVGVGMAMGAKLRKTDQKTYVLVGDGEINEGPIWEGALFAGHHKLSNFMTIVDENGFQAMGKTNEVLDLGAIEAKFASFGFESMTVDGHDENAVDAAVRKLWESPSRAPKALIARTVKGKGVSFMEHNNIWHYTRLNADTYAQAIEAVGAAR
ncbi:MULTISPECIES: transketolase [unclassified Achromobacter]|uniref:transketolase n=1 Tax=unclassified Achromobacter TaxID=2626865 RepID=UPI000B51B7E3|nr:MULTISPECIES: transketolase [unclassified Achromobacter]OWT74954.1 transketolase [Achromobacter sp. HZ28]OWT76562.1 transketolase [Achromobacter sp. HZ34]